MVDKFDAETISTWEDPHTTFPGGFTQIPEPRAWTNGDPLDAGTLNLEWRDTFNWMLRKRSPAFEGWNASAPTMSNGASIPITVESMIRGNITHAANDSKLYVWETGHYLVNVQAGINGGTATNFTSVLKVNGSVQTTGDVTRSSGGSALGFGHLSSVYLFSGDYVEFAVGGTWTGSVTLATNSYHLPMINLWWRTSGNGLNP